MADSGRTPDRPDSPFGPLSTLVLAAFVLAWFAFLMYLALEVPRG